MSGKGIHNMPLRPTIHNGTTTSPRNSSNAVNDVVSALQRKLTANHVENTQSNNAPRRASFSMDNILHLKKDKKIDQTDRNSREEKRKSGIKGSSKSRDRNATKSPRVAAFKPVRFEILRESPPLVMLHNAQNSYGALMSEKIKMHIDDPSGSVTLTKWTATLRAVRKTTKPIGKDCEDCKTQYDILKTEEFIHKPKTFHANKDNSLPYSYLFQGHLPATTECYLGGVSYELVVTAMTSNNESIKTVEKITIQRAVPEGPPKSSIRIFPPTNLTGRVQVPPVVHPIGAFPVEMKLSGVVDKRETAQTRWRLRKLMWRVEEHSKVISTPCPKHAHKVDSGKALQHEDTHTLGQGEMKTGWKSDFDTAGGEIWCEFEASINTRPNHKACCDVVSPSGLAVSHNLVIELIVAEEFCPNRNTQLITPTGAARVLRMQFNLIVTERAGMGISWEDEQPPMYDDVPASPPGYGSADKQDGAWGGAEMYDYHGEPLEYTELERLANPDPNAPPVYRERVGRIPIEENVNAGLPMRAAPAQTTNGESSGTTRRYGGYTMNELEEEPERFRRRNSSNDEGRADTEDVGEGSSAVPAQAAA